MCKSVVEDSPYCKVDFKSDGLLFSECVLNIFISCRFFIAVINFQNSKLTLGSHLVTLSAKMRNDEKRSESVLNKRNYTCINL